MCIALPGRVVEIVDVPRRVGRVEIDGAVRLVALSALDDMAPGDWVLVELGVATQKIDEAEARQMMRLLDELSAAFEEGLTPASDEEAGR